MNRSAPPNRVFKIGQRRRVAAGKDVAPHPGIGVRWAVPTSDRVEQHESIISQQVIALPEKRVVIPLADVFEHANGDDAIEFFRDLPIILNAKLAGKPFRSGPLLRNSHLFVEKIDADNRNLGVLREIETEPAPSASDVENLEAGPQQQLGGNVPLLGELRIVERSVAAFEISARILQVGIQKQAIDAIIDIVMMGRIAMRPPEGIALKDSARKRPQCPERATPRARLNPVEVFDSDVEKIRDRALLDDYAAIHIGFAESEFGIDKNAPFGCPPAEADRHGSS